MLRLSIIVALLGCMTGCGTKTAAPAVTPHVTKVQSPDCGATVSGKSAADDALRALQDKAAKSRTDAQALVAVGYGWIRKARTEFAPELYRNAESCAQQAAAASPDDDAVDALRGQVLLNDHRFSDARELGKAMIARDDRNPVAYGLLSDALLELGEVDDAIDAAQKMVDLKPNLASYGRAAHLRWLQGDVVGAKQLYQEAIAAGGAQRDPEPRVWMMVQAALVFWHEGDYAGADAGFDLALSILPQYAPALEGKGRVALARGDARAAVRWLERSQQLYPLVETSWLLGQAHARAGDRARARQAFEQVERDGKAHDPRTLALFYASHAREAATALALARSELKHRQDAYTKDALAYALYRDGQLTEAQKLSREALAGGVPDARLMYRASEIELAAGDAQRGQTLLAQARRLNPGFEPACLEGKL